MRAPSTCNVLCSPSSNRRRPIAASCCAVHVLNFLSKFPSTPFSAMVLMVQLNIRRLLEVSPVCANAQPPYRNSRSRTFAASWIWP